MGIPGLARRLEPYSTRYSPQDLTGCVAIIDGPSLAYYAQCIAAGQSRIPAYKDIDNAAIAWLNSLEDQGIKVSQILFDGALPESKRAERISRTEQNNRRIHQLRSNYPTTSCPIPTYLGSTSHAFLAPSLREALKDSPYASRTSVVSGEADDFCALHAKHLAARSIIFTSDTDLLLYDYHQETLIVFFQDAEQVAGLKAFSPHQTRRKLQLDSLVQLAYVVHQKMSEGQDDLVRDARGIDVQSAAYMEFSRRYTMSAISPKHLAEQHDLLAVLQTLDVRISEYIHQALGTSPDTSVYLPLLVEDANQASAWTMGQDIRILAYSLLSSQSSKIYEHKRKAQGISPHELSPYTSTDLLVPAKELETRLSGLSAWAKSKAISPPLLWSLFALGLVVVKLTTPPPLALITRVINGDFDNTWAFIQLTARLQAALYSLRMLKQISAVYLATHSQDSALYQHIASLHAHMSTFPTISEGMIVPGQAKRVLAEHEELKGLVEEIFIALGVEIPSEQVSNKKKKRAMREADRKKRKAEQRLQTQTQTQTQGSEGNIFALLDRS